MLGKGRYDDPCGIARALDVIGERWALLVVRELLLGSKRFTDLRRGLPTASQNVLSRRLHQLEAAGVVGRRRLGPPASTWVYELTERGYALEPVLVQLVRWGVQVPLTSTAELSVDSLMLVLKTTFDADAAGDLTTTIELRLGQDRFRATVAGGRLELARGNTAQADAVLHTNVATVLSLVFRGRSLASATRAADLTIDGDQATAARFVTSFRRPGQSTHRQAG